MSERKEFELPTITTFEREDLIVETAFTAPGYYSQPF